MREKQRKELCENEVSPQWRPKPYGQARFGHSGDRIAMLITGLDFQHRILYIG